MRKIIILSSVLVICVITMAIKYFSELSGNSSHLDKVLKYIPRDAALVLNFNNDESFYEIFRDYELFNAITGERKAAEISQLQKTLLRPSLLKDVTSNSKIFVSFHPTRADSVDFLFSINLNKEIPDKDVEDLLKGVPEITLNQSDKKGSYEITIKSINKKVFLFISDGVALASFSEPLLKICRDINSPKLDQDFINEINAASSKAQNSPVNLFINHNELPAFISNYLRGKLNGNTALLKNIKGFSSLNMNFKSDALMFNGISTVDSSSANYLNIFLGQKPVSNEIKKVLPANTANFIAFGISDHKRFQTDLKRHFAKKKDLQKLSDQFKLIRSKTGVNPDKDLLPLLGNEFVSLETANRERLAIIKVRNGRNVNFSLQLISTAFNEQISHFDHSNIPYYFFGDPLKYFSRPYYAVVDNYLVLSNSAGAVQQYLNAYNKQDFLLNTSEFSDYNQLLANQSNILYFVNSRNSENIARASLKKSYSSMLNDDNYGLKDFYGLSFQWSSDGDHFFTNLYINYTAERTGKLKLLWKYEMQGKPRSTPQVFEAGNKHFILVQDNADNLYALSPEGEKLWSMQLQGKLSGKILQMNDQSIVFNTPKQLYRLDARGNSITGFPVDLPFNATYGLTLSKVNSETRFFIPAGNFILGYDDKGQTLENWRKSLNGKILPELQAASLDGINYLVAGTETGSFYFFNQNGNQIGRIDDSKNHSYENPVTLEMGTDLKSSNIVTTDSSGTLIKVSFNGNLTRTNTGTWDKSHFFAYRNILGDENPELIYMEDKQLTVLNKDASPAFNYIFDNEIKSSPSFYSIDNFTYQIGLSSEQTGQLFLFNDDGSLVKGFPIAGTGNFYCGPIKNDGVRYVIGANNGRTLYVYKL